VTVRDGDLELTLGSDKARYTPGEPIVVTGSLVYRGARDTIEIVHDGNGPVLFGIRERVYGEIDLKPTSLLMFGRSTLQRNVPVDVPFRKSGGFTSGHPDAEMFKAFMLDPVLRLPSGTWHLYAVASGGSGGDPNREHFTLEAEVAIEVGSPTASSPAAAR
jgi:hypothetical protein